MLYPHRWWVDLPSSPFCRNSRRWQVRTIDDEYSQMRGCHHLLLWRWCCCWMHGPNCSILVIVHLDPILFGIDGAWSYQWCWVHRDIGNRPLLWCYRVPPVMEGNRWHDTIVLLPSTLKFPFPLIVQIHQQKRAASAFSSLLTWVRETVGGFPSARVK